MMKKKGLKYFLKNERSGGLVLIICTILSLIISNSVFGVPYLNFWNISVGGHDFILWVNDALMPIFFLFVGLELIKELRQGELSNLKTALLPISAAVGGMLIPALIYLIINFNVSSRVGAGIPMATDIAFAVAILSLLGKRVPLSLRIFFTALAVIDDLGAIIVIAVFYTEKVSLLFLFLALGIFIVLLLCNYLFKIRKLSVYIIGGIFLWYFMLHSGIHATIAGVLLAITIPHQVIGNQKSLSAKMEHWLNIPVQFVILPLFALANMAMRIDMNWYKSIGDFFALGIILGLIVGKPLGISLFSYVSVKLKLCNLSQTIKWKYLVGVGLLGGIGFTMSIFITGLAFKDNLHYVNDAKLMIVLSSLIAGILGYIWLYKFLPKKL